MGPKPGWWLVGSVMIDQRRPHEVRGHRAADLMGISDPKRCRYAAIQAPCHDGETDQVSRSVLTEQSSTAVLRRTRSVAPLLSFTFLIRGIEVRIICRDDAISQQPLRNELRRERLPYGCVLPP
jgi:hypothetical protein